MSRKRRSKKIVRGDGNRGRRRLPDAPDSGSWGMHDFPVGGSASLLMLVAKQVTAAGSLDRAIDLGLVEVPPAMLGEVRAMLPAFLGGEADGPEIRADWAEVVRVAEENTGCTVQQLRDHLGLK